MGDAATTPGLQNGKRQEVGTVAEHYEVIIRTGAFWAVNPALTAMANALRVGEVIRQRIAP
jgi:hypothetical protein